MFLGTRGVIGSQYRAIAAHGFNMHEVPYVELVRPLKRMANVWGALRCVLRVVCSFWERRRALCSPMLGIPRAIPGKPLSGDTGCGHRACADVWARACERARLSVPCLCLLDLNDAHICQSTGFHSAC